RLLREEVFRKVAVRRQQDEKALDDLMDQLISIRHQVARNAGFDNYRDYKFRELGRFDYTVNDCMQFHQSVKECILPLVDAVFAEKKKVLGIPELKPWDTDAEPAGREPLKPFTDGSELLAKSIAVFDRLMPFLAQCLTKMKQLGHFDLDSRKGKAPGGYNCPLAETGAPFIFMNAAGTADDVVTMMHEGGHAIHSFLCHPLPLNAFKEYPMEMAELASMSMELFSMEHWDVFYPGATELKRAQAEELERILIIFPWIACIDEFQHWMYTHPEHTAQERKEKWVSLHRSYQSKELNWQDMEDYRTILWQKQLHLFEVPFYYIEYGIAQLGAIALWMNFRKNPFGTLNSYLQALSKGYTMDLKKLYQTAGIPFDMSRNRIQELSDFTFERLTELYQ
ncbi:MAG TPA: M3 family oligoendopeptidase, partial [Chitinophagaceae bacterium]|nr:M3 family oligoendopeptidase [Chitinophagaceae bacterium]